MSTAQPTTPQGPSRGSHSGFRLSLSRRARWLLAGGFGVGLLMFFLLWLDMRENGNFYRPAGKTGGTDGQIFEPLPAPATDRTGSASGLSEAAEAALRNPRPAPPPVQQAPRPAETPTERPQADASGQNDSTSRPTAPGDVPVPISRPSPRYPADALRNNETGTVLLRITVDERGEPVNVEVARSSRSRSLDRAAAQAARRWTFRPAQQNGRAVTATVEVPIAFSLGDDAR
jgi:TonB family protein